MKQILLFLFTVFSALTFSQQAGDIVSIEKKLDLTPSGVTQYVAECSGSDVTPELLSLFENIDLGLLAYKVTYWTTDYNDNLAKATGLVMWPKTSKRLSTVLYCHPTTDKRENVPSNLKDVATLGFVLPLTYAISEYVVVAPDYYGYGDGDGIPNYTDVKTTSNSILDMLTASNTFLETQNLNRYNQNFITGYSLGGHAGMATIKKATEDNSYEFDFAFLGAGPHDLAGATLQGGVVDQQYYPYSAFLSYVVFTADNLGYDLNNGDWRNVFSEEYYDAFYKANIEQEYGLFWGPREWRKLFTEEFVEAAENDINHPLRQYARDNNVYDWYNKTPTTMSGGWFDDTIPRENNYVAQKAQRSYYAWWDWNKYKIKAVDVGPFEHFVGTVPWLLGSIYEFNTKRKGGFFNTFAYQANAFQLPTEKDAITLERSSVANTIKSGKETLKTIPHNREDKEDITYVERIELPNGTVKNYPMMKEQAVEVSPEELINQLDENVYELNLHGLEDDIEAVNVFRNNSLVKRYAINEDFTLGAPIQINDLQTNDLIEVVTKDVILTSTYKIERIDPAKQQDIIITQNGNSVTVMNQSNKFTTVEIINQSGQIIQTRTDAKNQYTFNLNKGFYLIRMLDDKQQERIEKVVVM